MMRRIAKAFLLAAAAAWFLPAGASPQAQTDSVPEIPAVRSDTSLVVTPFTTSISLTERFEQNTARPLSSYLGVSAARFYGWEKVERPRYECVLLGADMGFTYGLVAGAAGMSAGVWDEPTAWYVAGAAAMLGAILGNKLMANDPAFRVRLKWEPSEHDPWKR
jgi:hypothetical protein